MKNEVNPYWGMLYIFFLVLFKGSQAKAIHQCRSFYQNKNTYSGSNIRKADYRHLTQKRIENNDYQKDRSGEAYLSMFSNFEGEYSIKEYIKKLSIDSHYADMGAGTARAMHGLAQGVKIFGEVFTIKIESRGLTAISYSSPSGYFSDQIKKLEGRQFRYLSGRKVEDIPKEEIGSVNLITDVFGPFSYSDRPDLILVKYLEVLKVTGRAYIYFTHSNTVINNKSLQEGLLPYLNSIQGVKVKYHGGTDLGAIIIEKTNNSFLVPTLKLYSFFDGKTPVRYLIWNSEPQ